MKVNSNRNVHDVSKKKNYKWFIGIDVSKNKLDYAVLKGSELILHYIGQNTTKDVLNFCSDLKKMAGFKLKSSLFCMEQSGFYTYPSLQAFHKLKADVVCEHALRIKRSGGVLRGKTDKEDAIRIATYAEQNNGALRLWAPRRPVLAELMHLSTLRSRLLGISVIVTNPLNEQAEFISPQNQKKIRTLCAQTVQAIKSDLDVVDQSINMLIDNDDHLRHLMQLITSVIGVGRVTAIDMIIATNEFRDIQCPKKFACYAGVAPFKTQSGLMVKKARVSHMANKRSKSLLHLCALNAVKADNDLKAYYIRKTQSEGRPKMLVLNAVRNKLILRIFACLKQNRVYNPDYNRVQAVNGSMN